MHESDLSQPLKYEGQWSLGSFHGKGTLYDEDGLLIYDGEFYKGNYHGHGKLYWSGKNRTKNGRFQSDGRLVYEGPFVYGEKTTAGKAAWRRRQWRKPLHARLAEKALLDLHARAAERVYAPGGAGYEAAQQSFASAFEAMRLGDGASVEAVQAQAEAEPHADGEAQAEGTFQKQTAGIKIRTSSPADA